MIIPVSPPYKVRVTRYPYGPYSHQHQEFEGFVIGYMEKPNMKPGECPVFYLIQNITPIEGTPLHSVYLWDPSLWRIEVI